MEAPPRAPEWDQQALDAYTTTLRASEARAAEVAAINAHFAQAQQDLCRNHAAQLLRAVLPEHVPFIPDPLRMQLEQGHNSYEQYEPEDFYAVLNAWQLSVNTDGQLFVRRHGSEGQWVPVDNLGAALAQAGRDA